MNKKGFTLVELLATMAILAIISVIAVPNVIKVMDENKKEKMINDAMSLIALAKYEVARDYDFREGLTTTGTTLTLKNLDTKDDLAVDPDGAAYDREASYVKVSKDSECTITYCVYLKSSNRTIDNTGDCVLENIILGDNAKNYVNDVES